jgi:hypothetical protein
MGLTAENVQTRGKGYAFPGKLFPFSLVGLCPALDRAEAGRRIAAKYKPGRLIGRLLLLAPFALVLFIQPALAQTKPDKDYLVYVRSESADKIALIRFGPSGARIDHQLETGDMPVDIDGPHGIIVSPDRGDNSCSPTWAQPSADGSSIFVACNKSSEIVEVNADTWQLVRRIPAGAGVYNLAVTHDGTRLVGTNKRDQSVSIFDLKTGSELARLPTKRKVLHGVVVSPDNRYAFVSVEGIG